MVSRGPRKLRKMSGTLGRHMHLRHFFMILGLTGLCACAQAPQIDGAFGAVDRDAPFPDLIPLAQLTAGTGTPARITPETNAALANRIAALRARAARLRGPVVDNATRAKMNAAIARAALR